MDGGFKPTTEHTITSGGGFAPSNPAPVAPKEVEEPEAEEPTED